MNTQFEKNKILEGKVKNSNKSNRKGSGIISLPSQIQRAVKGGEIDIRKLADDSGLSHFKDLERTVVSNLIIKIIDYLDRLDRGTLDRGDKGFTITKKKKKYKINPLTQEKELVGIETEEKNNFDIVSEKSREVCKLLHYLGLTYLIDDGQDIRSKEFMKVFSESVNTVNTVLKD